MRDILNAILSTLQGTTLLSYVGDSVIVIEPSNNHLPIHGAFPMISIKDGEISRVRDFTGQSTGLMVEEKVYINLWQQLLADSESIVGNGTTRGVLNLEEDVNSVLHINTLSLSCILDVYCNEESAAEVIPLGDLTVVRKTMVYTYKKLEVK